MANSIEKTLSPVLFEDCNREKIVFLSTVNNEKNTPVTNAISWLIALDDKTIRFAVDQRSFIVSNIEAVQGVSLSLFSNETVYSILGDAKVLTKQLPSIPLKLACIEVEIKEVKNILFYGSKIVTEPAYAKTYDERAAKKLDLAVLNGLKTYEA
ncbi:pyridoxamine 5'-phosphate oxidase family protein [Bacillus sp. EAC]|uniref:pyridoxamine 5'-phosphate oxidase family protein n=1 Tax=Bacillus sp. EAC TaxID=1978338 RepID=UPI000B452615|nr:pyridoxamine 5'-phosphate oxidase family protein [Bacillus sp. EAC]